MTTTHADFIRAMKGPNPWNVPQLTALDARLEAIARLLEECRDVLDNLLWDMDRACLPDEKHKRIDALVEKLEAKS